MDRRNATPTACGLVAALLLAVASGCGAAGQDRTPPPTSASAAPALARAARVPGEVVLRADASPRTHGPIALNGRYLVRFEQYAPEDPNTDFTAQTAFVVDLRRSAAGPARRLFRAARAHGRTTVALHGRYLVDVTFGDFPYVVRFTPVRR